MEVINSYQSIDLDKKLAHRTVVLVTIFFILPIPIEVVFSFFALVFQDDPHPSSLASIIVFLPEIAIILQLLVVAFVWTFYSSKRYKESIHLSFVSFLIFAILLLIEIFMPDIRSIYYEYPGILSGVAIIGIGLVLMSILVLSYRRFK